MTADTLIYLHIPKTGGTTMMDVLQANYGRGFYRTANYPQPERIWEADDETKRSITCLAGHMSFGAHTRLPQTAVYAAMVRHPLERIFSLYTYIRSRPQHASHKLAVFRTLGDFVQEQVVAGTENGMVRILAGRGDFGVREAAGCVTEADYEQALMNLDRWFVFVGLTERYEESVQRMAACWGWAHTDYEAKLVQQRPHVNELDQQTVDLISRHNRYDLQLYDYVLGKYWENER